MRINRVIALSLGVVVQTIAFGAAVADSPKSCKEIKEGNSSSASRTYTIDPDGKGGNEPFAVYCEMSGEVGLTFHLVKKGIATAKVSDNDNCKKLGLKIFAPRTEADYESARKYLSSIKELGSFGPLGVYNPKAGSAAARIPMNSKEAGAKFGWKSTAGDNWWISNRSDITEPNGDYVQNCWLGIQYDNIGKVKHYNDGHCDYSYETYLCMSEDNYALPKNRCQLSITAKTNEKQLEPDDEATYHVVLKQESSCCRVQNIATTVSLVDKHTGLSIISKPTFSLPDIGPLKTAETEISFKTIKAAVKKNHFKIALDYECVIVVQEKHNQTFDIEVVED